MEGKCAGEKVDVKRVSSQSFSVSSPGCQAGKTVVSYAAYPGWRAFSKDVEVKIETSMDVFQAMKGGGNLQLVYEPMSFRIGLWVSIMSVIFSMVFIFRRSNLLRGRSG